MEKILVAGYVFNGTDNDFAAARYNTDGSLDNTFSVDGKVTTDLGGSAEACFSVAMQPDGKILVAGFTNNVSDLDFALVRYNTDGTLDNTFSVDGKVTMAIGSSNDRGYSVAIQPDGKILVAGWSNNGSDNDFALVRYNADGTIDNTFSLDGKVTTDIGFDDDRGYSVAIQPDGKILVAGFSGNETEFDFAIVRYLSGLNVGAVDFSVEDQSALVYPNPIQNQAALGYSLAQEENLSIKLFDITGKLMKTFVDQERRGEGDHKEELNFPESISAGQYVLVIDNGSGNRSIKVIVQ